MSTLVRSLTLNGFTATLTIPTKLDEHNMLTCKLAVTQTGWGNNSSQTSFTFKVDSAASSTAACSGEPVKIKKLSTTATVTTAPAPTASTTTTTEPAKTETEKQKHITFIKGILDDYPNIKGLEARGAAAKILFDYLSGEALEFVKNHKKFKDVVISKAYQLKKEAPELTALVASMDRVLTALGVPLKQPVAVPGCSCKMCSTAPKTPANTVVEPTTAPPAPAPAPAAPAPAVTAVTTSDPDLVLFMAVARKLKCTTALKYPTEYLGYWRGVVKRGSYTGKSKADSMAVYLTGWWGYYNEDIRREKLMKDLFEKNKLPYDPVVMDMYYEWVKTYTPPARPRTNRYLKMVAFIKANRSAFTTL